MASITQTISGFISGISQQPDELMLPGQVKDLCNGLPDITDGLVKRSGSRFLASLSGATTTGSWFSYYRDANEGAYIGQIQTNGNVNIWKASDGTAVTVNGSATSYLTHSTNDLKFLTVADTTFVTNVGKTVAMTSATTPARNPTYQAYIELRQTGHGREYEFSVSTPTAQDSIVGPANTGRATSIKVDLPPKGTPPNGFTSISRDNSQTGIDPALQHQATEIFTVSSGNGKHLVFRLTTTGQVNVQTNPGSEINANDYVGIYNTTAELLNGGYGWAPNNTVTVQMRGVNYTVTIKTIQQINSKNDRGFFRPAPSSFDANVDVSPAGILSQAQQGSGMGQINLSTVQRIGNGIFLADSNPFRVETSQPDLWRITTLTINDPSELPRQCKHNMIVQVSNSDDSLEDDYYLQFKGANDADGAGFWEECAAPGIQTTLDASTLPIQIQRQANGQFQISSPPWVTRAVGDDTTNPVPSLIGNKISQTFFHRNRLGFLTEDNVVLSQGGDVYNFFQQSALTIGPNDPIDIQASSTQPTRFLDSIETNTGLIIFSESQQFMLHTDSDTLTPDTGKLSNISTYRYSPQAAPISLGTTIGFVDSAGVYGRFFEMFDIRREGEPQIIDQTKIVQSLLPNDLDIVINSRENNTIFFSKSGTNNVYGYRYYNTGDKRVQSAWFRWELPYDIEYAFVLDDALLLISDTGKYYEIQLIKKDSNRIVPGPNNFYGQATEYKIHLDASQSITAGSYDASNNITTVNWSGPSNTNVAVVDPSDGSTFAAKSSSGSTHTFTGNLANKTLIIGNNFTFKVEMPKIYVKQKSGDKTTADVNASLTVQRANIRYGAVGTVEFKVYRAGKSDFVNTFDSTIADYYGESDMPVIEEKTVKLPIYERNQNFNIEMNSTHPGPASLHSMSWEGDYTPMYHKRV
jgi:hypothetical protein